MAQLILMPRRKPGLAHRTPCLTSSDSVPVTEVDFLFIMGNLLVNKRLLKAACCSQSPVSGAARGQTESVVRLAKDLVIFVLEIRKMERHP